MNNFKKITACALTLVMLLSGFAVFADGDENYDGILGLKSSYGSGNADDATVAIDTTDDDINNDVVFVGEYIYSDLYLKNTSKFSAATFAVNFNTDFVKLYSYATEDTEVESVDGSKPNLIFDLAAASDMDGVGTYGVRLKKDAVNGWNDEILPTVSKTFPVISNEEGLVAVGAYSTAVPEGTEIGNDAITFYQMKFKALNPGNPSIKFAVEGDNVYHELMPSGYSVAVGSDLNAEKLNMKVENESFEIKERPDTPTNVMLSKVDDKYTASWDKVASRGYTVTLKYKDPKGQESVINTYNAITANETSCEVTGLDKTGAYYVTVVAKGKDKNSVEARSVNELIISEDLKSPTVINLTAAGKYEWGAIENAASYDVDIYEVVDETPVYVKTVNVNENSIDMTKNVEKIGTYQITVKPNGDGVYYITPESASGYSPTYSNGTSVSGIIQLLGLGNQPLTGEKISCADVEIKLINKDGLFEKNENGEIKKDDNGNPIPWSKSKTASKNGSFEITAIPSGTYDIVISKRGALTTTFTDALLTGDAVEISTSEKPVQLYQGETDGDGAVIFNEDIGQLIGSYDKKVEDLAAELKCYDFNQDGVVHLEDISILLNNLEETAKIMTFEEWKAN